MFYLSVVINTYTHVSSMYEFYFEFFPIYFYSYFEITLLFSTVTCKNIIAK